MALAQGKEKKAPLVPKLRFKEFAGDGEWEEKRLDRLAIAINDKALSNNASFVLTLSCDLGLIVQGDYFGRKIASQDTSKYTKIIENDFVYNDRITTSSKYGTIKKLSCIDGGLVSPIYKCFRFKKDEISVFWEWYFASGTHESELKKLINEGAREGRYNISIAKFLSIQVLCPATPEQQRIADCLTSLDETIAAESQKLEALTAHKKALMQKLFPAEGEKVPVLRFKEFVGAGQWEEKSLNRLATAISDKALSNDTFPALTLSCNVGLIVQGDYFRRKIASQDTSKYTKIVENDFVYNDRITTSSKYGTIKKLSCIDGGLVSPIYKCFRFRKDEISVFWEWYFASGMHEIELKKLINEGAREGRYNISILKFLSIQVLRPATPEQQRIADFLTSLDELITTQTRKIDLLKEHKKGLMQQLFPKIEEE